MDDENKVYYCNVPFSSSKPADMRDWKRLNKAAKDNSIPRAALVRLIVRAWMDGKPVELDKPAAG